MANKRVQTSNRNVGFCPTLVGLCPRGLLSYGLLSYTRSPSPLAAKYLLRFSVQLERFFPIDIGRNDSES